MARAKKTEATPLPDLPSCKVADAMGLNVVSYMNRSEDTAGGSFWLPRDMVGRDGKTLIVFRPASRDSGYAVDGWFPYHDGMTGGCYQTPRGALRWVQRAMDIRAGKATDFLGY